MHKIVVIEGEPYTLAATELTSESTLREIGEEIKEALNLHADPIRFCRHVLTSYGVVCNITKGDVCLQILPKGCPLTGGANSASVRDYLSKVFTQTLKCSCGSLDSVLWFSKSQIADGDSLLIDIIAEFYLSTYTQASRRTKIATFEPKYAPRRNVKGRVLVRKMLAQPIISPFIWCKFKEIATDNIYNQLLAWAFNYLAKRVADLSLRRRLSSAAIDLMVGDDKLDYANVVKARLPKNFQPFQTCFEIAKGLFLGHESWMEKSGGSHISGYAINMQRSFENIVAFYLTQAASNRALKNSPQQALDLAHVNNGTPGLDYNVRPDNVVFNPSSGKVLIVDAKYKTLTTLDPNKRKPSREDFYQMISSCLAFQTNEAVLVYPVTHSFPANSWQTCCVMNGQQVRISANSIDLTCNDATIIASFDSILSSSSL